MAVDSSRGFTSRTASVSYHRTLAAAAHAGKALQIRPAGPADAPVLTKISTQAKAHWPYAAAQLHAWGNSLRIEPSFLARSVTYVGEVDGEPIAFYSLLKSADAWHLEHLWVLPKFIGQGLGKVLLQHAKSLAYQSGIQTITIDSEPYAEPFYLACGAKRIGTVPAPIDGEPMRHRPQLILRTGS
jgi:GNAT superfamily N-acetyltransferase